MYVCVYIYIYDKWYTYIYIYIYTHMYTYIRTCRGARGHAGQAELAAARGLADAVAAALQSPRGKACNHYIVHNNNDSDDNDNKGLFLK